MKQWSIKTTVRKSEELQGPTKTKKITVTDFKKETPKKNEVKSKKNLLPYERVYNGVEVYYKFYKFINQYDLINENDLKTVSEDYLNFKNYKIGSNKDYVPIEKTEHARKKTFVYYFNGNVTKILGNYLLNIYRQQKFTFKLTIEFSFLRIKVDDDDLKKKI